MATPFYKGISFKAFEVNKSLRSNDVELVKQDILNSIFTRRGERVMMPMFGTRIEDMVMEQLDSTSLSIIRRDITTALSKDPRVEIETLNVVPIIEERAVVVMADLRYIEIGITDRLDIYLKFND